MRGALAFDLRPRRALSEGAGGFFASYLVGEQAEIGDAKIVHFTTGVPYMAGHEVDLYADEWFDELTRWAA